MTTHKFTMRMPFHVHEGARQIEGNVTYYTASVHDKYGREIALGDSRARSVTSQTAANELAVRKAREWAQRVRHHAGV